MNKKIKGILFLIIILVIIIFKIGGNKKNTNHEVIKQFSVELERTSQEFDNKVIVKENEKFGIVDIDGNKIRENKYDYILRLDKNIYFLQEEENKYLYDLDTDKQIKIDEVSIINENLYKVKYNKKYGIVDSDLRIVLEIENNFIDNNQENILVFNGKSINLYDKKMTKINIKNRYEKIKLGIGKYLYAKKNGLWGIIDKTGEEKTEFKYDSFLEINDSDIVVGYTEGKSYLINLKETETKETETNYDNYGLESDNKIMVLKNGKIGYIDIFGKEVIPIIYDGGFLFNKDKDFIQVKKENKWYLLDFYGNKYKELEIDDLGDYIEGYMLIEKNGKYGYIDKEGDIKIPLEYDFAHDFSNGLAVVAGDHGYGVIDKENSQILPLKYDEVKIEDEYIFVIENNKYGLYSIEGKEILEAEYDHLNKINKDIVFFRKQNKTGFIKLK